MHSLLIGAAALFLLQFANLAIAAQVTPAAELSSCVLRGVARSARCGSVEVPENPERPNGRQLAIGFAVVPAAAERALPDPIVVLMGGPGEEAISAADLYARQFDSLLQDRDLLLIDQRGTGRSGALRCELFSAEDPATSLQDLFPPDAVRRCSERLRAQADLTQYTFGHFSRDLEHVRRALGYRSLNLFAGSYGTRAAQVFVRAYPASVRTVYMGSIVPIDVVAPLTFAQTTDRALERLFQACTAESRCRDVFADLPKELEEVVARLDAGVRVTIPGAHDPAALNRGRFVEWLRGRLYRPDTAASVPWFIHEAYQARWGSSVEGILANAKGLDTAVSLGLFFSITCSEDIAYMREEDIRPATRDTFLGDYRVRQQQAACGHWPKASLPRGYRAPVYSSAPTMFVSGDIDAASPLWFTRHAAPGFSNRIEIVLAGRGHTEWNKCVGRLYERFVRSGSVSGLDASCEPAPRPPFKTR